MNVFVGGDFVKKGKQKKGKGGIIAILICIIVILALIGVIIYLMQDRKESDNSVGTERKVLEERKSVVVSEEMSDEEIENMLPHSDSKPVNFTESMSHTWTFSNGESASVDGYVTNHTDNQYAYYFDVVRDDTKEVIYSSPIIPVGSTLRDIVLDKKLSKGEYECTMECHFVEADNITEYSSINMILTIVVEN